ncbi:MAG: F0F1 ATP synthase subunit A [Candidatus Sumerlaeia bacterium]|nr:F0F1 ATP synthase subunit A [Candidatus Sumerlaeia bacterium]
MINKLPAPYTENLNAMLYKVNDDKLIVYKDIQEQSPQSEQETKEHTTEESSTEVANLITLLKVSPIKDKAWVKTLAQWENPFFTLIPVILISIIVIKIYRHRTFLPDKLQNAIEFFVETLDKFVCETMGKENGRKFLPYIGSLFLFIWFNNLLGIIPFMKSPTSSYRTTIALAICTFCYVQAVAVTRMGLWGYLYHLAGSPKGIIMWLVVPIMFPMHIIGELAKPLSLSLRLFGNIFGEDTLIGVFAILGIMAMSFIGIQQPVVGFPLQIPFLFLAVLTGTIQALVFSLLSMIYFIMVLPAESH